MAESIVYQTLQEQVRRRRLRIALQSTRIFGALDPALLRDLEVELTWVTLRSGETLIRQGDQGDCLYVVISGRLRIVLERDGQAVRTLREVGRGESIGEMALITGEQRAATVYAIRDSEVARLSQADFERLLDRYPRAITHTFTRSIIESLTRQLAGEKPGIDAVTAVAILPASKEVLLAEFTQRLVEALTAIGPTLHLSSTRVDAYLGKPGSAQTNGASDQATDTPLVAWLSEQETKYRHLVYEADPAASAWSQRCLRQADHILIVGHATGDPAPGELETMLLSSEVGRARKRQSLVLLHRAGSRLPTGTQRWLAARQVDQHLHVRWQNEADFGRLARFVAGRSLGLALGGGGARGFAHIGVIRALAEAGIPIDMVGGTSMGALIAAQYAMGWSAQAMLDACRGYGQAVLFDYTLPVVSLMSGLALVAKLKEYFGYIQVEDLWLPFFCVSTNLTRATKMVHRTGLVWQAVRASGGVSGVLPPVIHHEDALVDGALLDILPANIMRDLCGNGTVLAVDVVPPVDLAKISSYGDGLSGWRALNSSLNPLASKLDIPNLMALLYRTMEVGSIHDQSARQPGVTDLYFCPPVTAFSIADHLAIDEIVEIAYQYARAEICRWREGR